MIPVHELKAETSDVALAGDGVDELPCVEGQGDIRPVVIKDILACLVSEGDVREEPAEKVENSQIVFGCLLGILPS